MKAKQQQNSAAALMQAEFPLYLLGRVCLTNVAQTGINETLRCVMLIILQTIQLPLLHDFLGTGFPEADRAAPKRPTWQWHCRQAAGEAKIRPAKGLKFIKDAAPNVPMRGVQPFQ